ADRTEGKDEGQALMRVILFVSLVFQWASMLFINSVFIQYYIPINWLYAVFGAFFIVNLISQFQLMRLLQSGVVLILLVLLIFLWKSSVLGNFARAKMTDEAFPREINEYWKMIPEDQPAYPNVLFRKPIYPLLWGQVISENVRDRYPPVYIAIEKYRLKTLTGLTDDFLSYLDFQSQSYILTHYVRDSPESRIWRRKE
ncbi:hypothetical protein HYW87_02275, partial [Candidatus Roizmanbacteria bacterium]|nr:hypothetical protein [Candidatus Roizmanbacteria bacterium]